MSINFLTWSYDGLNHSAMMCSLGLVNKFHFIEFYLKFLNGRFLCCHEQVKKNLERLSRSLLSVQPKGMGD